MKAFTPLLDIDSVLPILSEIAIFGGMTDDQMHAILGSLETGLYAIKEPVFEKGEEPTHVYIVKRGKIELSITDGEIVLEKKTLRVGDCFGLASLMAMHRHTATAVALEPSEVIVLSRSALIRLQKEDCRLFSLLMMNVSRELARRLKLTDELLLQHLRTEDV